MKPSGVCRGFAGYTDWWILIDRWTWNTLQLCVWWVHQHTHTLFLWILPLCVSIVSLVNSSLHMQSVGYWSTQDLTTPRCYDTFKSIIAHFETQNSSFCAHSFVELIITVSCFNYTRARTRKTSIDVAWVPIFKQPGDQSQKLISR